MEKDTGSFFALKEIEGRVPAEGEVWLDGWKFWVGVVVSKPEGYKGQTVMLRFPSADDPNYRLLTSNYGRIFRISVKEGQGVVSRGAIVFVSDRPASFTLLPKEPPDATLQPNAAAKGGSL